MTEPNIYTAILEIQKDLPVVPKRRSADTGKYSYSFADIADLTAAVLPRLNALDVVYVCEHTWREGEQFLNGRLIHAPSGTEVLGSIAMRGLRTPQEIGSGTTYFRRYLLGCLTGVLTDNDEDGTIASKVQGETVEAELAAATTPEEVIRIATERGLKEGTPLKRAALARHAALTAELAENSPA